MSATNSATKRHTASLYLRPSMTNVECHMPGRAAPTLAIWHSSFSLPVPLEGVHQRRLSKGFEERAADLQLLAVAIEHRRRAHRHDRRRFHVGHLAQVVHEGQAVDPLHHDVEQDDVGLEAVTEVFEGLEA